MLFGRDWASLSDESADGGGGREGRAACVVCDLLPVLASSVISSHSGITGARDHAHHLRAASMPRVREAETC